MKYQFVIPHTKKPVVLEGLEPLGALRNAGYRAGKMHGKLYIHDKDRDKWEEAECLEVK